MRPGEIVELRSVFGGHVRWAFPWRVVADDGESIVLHLAPGAEGVSMGRDQDGRYIDRWATDDPAKPHTWHSRNVVSVTRRGDAHSIWLLYDERWEFEAWYVQLQSPLVERDGALETTDHALDIVVEPDGRWSWKDEGDFAEAIGLGAFSDEEARAIRAEGERVVAAKPWPTGWEDWRP